MKVSILSNGKITTTQYNNVSVDGQVEVMGGGGIEAETDPIFKAWKDSEYSILQNSIQTNSEDLNQTKGCVTALSNSVNELSCTVVTLGCTVATKADASTVSTLCTTVANLGCDLNGFSGAFSDLSCAVSYLGCEIGNKISYGDLCFSDTGCGYTYISVRGISTNNLYPIDCGTSINISCITAETISANGCYLDLYAYGSEVYIADGYVNINSQCAVKIDSPSFYVQYGCMSSLSIQNYCNSSYININADSVLAAFDSGCVYFLNTGNCTYSDVWFDDRGFALYADTNGSCTRTAYSITRWMEAPDSGGGYIPVFSEI